MVAYPTAPSIVADIRKLKADVRQLQIQVAGRVPLGPASGAPVYDANVLSNGGIESGVVGWGRGLWSGGGTQGVLDLDEANPMDGLRSLRMNEAANTRTFLNWRPAGEHSAPVVGVDVFATSPGDVWKISGTMRSTVTVPGAALVGACGAAAADCYDVLNTGGGFTAVTAATLTLTAGVVTLLSGTITVPAGRNFIGFECFGTVGGSEPSTAWAWEIDSVSLQKKL
jgi:hypothetical protein